jgi:hypothetical protein
MNEEKSRRNVLKFGLAGVAGMMAGHSILKTDAFAAGAAFQVSIPTLSHVEGVLTPQSRNQALESLAPVFAGIVQASGINLNPQQFEALKGNLVSRGALRMPTAAADGVTISSLSLGLRSGMR